MFSGIIESMGSVAHLDVKNETMTLSIVSSEIAAKLQLGHSVSVNGVCLTVADLYGCKKDEDIDSFIVSVMPETHRATNLQYLQLHDCVNLEVSLTLNSYIGGHLVTGHVDTTATIAQIVHDGNAVNYKLAFDNPQFIKYCMLKGSIAVNGISLTIFGVDKNTVSIAIIPHTFSHTNLQYRKVGDMVNIECDMIGKYITNCVSNYKS